MRVISATYDNIPFLNNLLQKNMAVVFFVAPWCGHCRALEPSLNKIMGRFSTSRRNGVIARVSEGDIKQIKCDNDIQGFPTIRVLKNGKKVKDYEGQRDEKSLNAFLADVFNENLKQPNKVRKPIKVRKPMNVEPKKGKVGPRKLGPRKLGTRKLGPRKLGPRKLGPRKRGKQSVGPKKRGKQLGGTRKRGPKQRPKRRGTRKRRRKKGTRKGTRR